MTLQKLHEMQDRLSFSLSVFTNLLNQKDYPNEDKESLLKPVRDAINYLEQQGKIHKTP